MAGRFSEAQIREMARQRFEREIHPDARFSGDERASRMEVASDAAARAYNEHLSPEERLILLENGFLAYPYYAGVLGVRAALFQELGNYEAALHDVLALIFFWHEDHVDWAARLLEKLEG
jgi:hypothetical protein